MPNEMPCGTCVNYDPILGSNDKDTKMGWCVKRSRYPHQEGPGQVFPPNVERVEPGALAQPFIVKKEQVVPQCALAHLSKVDPVAQKRQSQTQTDAKGNRIHH